MKKLISFIVSICSLYNIYAQIPEAPKTVLSPNASSLGLYGEIPVSCFTGTPSINIPLYEFKSGDFSFPISLSYHASGVRPDQHPGWTGLGWSLNAGGVISRIVNDMPDESNNNKYDNGVGKNAGYYYYHEVLNRADWNQREYLRSVAQSDSSILKDTESDKYSFDFMGYHGNFYIDASGQWKVQCDKSVEVRFSGNFINIPFIAGSTRGITYGYSPSFEGFTLITEDGTQYIFGGSDTAIEYSIDFFNQHNDDWIATSWYLTKIINPNKDEINLTYERGDFINQMYISVHQVLGSYAESSGGIFNLLDPDCSYSESASINSSYQGKLIAPVYLKNIILPNARVDLLRGISTELRYDKITYDWKYLQWYRAGASPFLPYLSQENNNDRNYLECLDKLKWQKLNCIQIYNNENFLIRRFEFSYNNNSSQRLLLKTLQETSGNNPDNTITSGKKYSFEYNQPDSLPAYLANKTDHWGFYNNTYAQLDSNYYTHREPNASVLQYGILNKIIYPTGGYTRFVFEPHTYRKQLGLKRWESLIELPENKIAGGLRIKKIINSTTGNITDEKTMNEYFYVSDYLQNKDNANKSSGVLGGQSQYNFSDYEVYAFKNKNTDDKDVKYMQNIFSSQSVLPGCNNSCGSHIGYTEVIEKRSDNAYKRYQYTNFDNGHMDEPCDAIIQLSRTPYEPYSSKEQERGLPLLIQDYDSNGILKKSKIVEYEKDDNSSENYVKMMKAIYKNVCPETAVSYDEGTAYRMYTYNFRTAKETENVYENTTYPITFTTNYLYNENKLLKEISKTTNNGIYKINYKRPDEYTTDVYSSMVVSHVLSPIVEEIHSLYQDGISKILKHTRYNYAKWANDSLYFYAPSSVDYSIGSAALENRIVYNGYDKKGNPVYTVKDSIKTVYVWGYNYQYLVGEVKNATLTEVQGIIGDLNLFASALVPDFTKLDQLRTSLKNAEVTSYGYKPLYGLTSKTDPNGVTTYYEYDSLGRLLNIKDNSGKIVNTYKYNYKLMQ
ncbi:hypothetical protein [uncultured Bacteroides sp.]|uniref:RHS repeat domain-containing protein n=1 Tax=uncultured Bacteroides sp. TaxID=162156 RepID=UPI002AAA77EE|nr:hypothetical protein [uncultured Bacteroides sp.]